MKRNALGQLIPALHICSFNDDAGTGGGGGDNGAGGNAGGEFTPPASQEELDRLIAGRVARAERNAREDERRKFTAQHPTGKDDDKNDDGKPAGLTEDDVDKRIADARAAWDRENAIERAGDRLDKALVGRVFSASMLFSLDRSQFVKDDGKTVDDAAIAAWVSSNSTEAKAGPFNRQRGQGQRGSDANGGSVQSGRDLFQSENTKRKD
ncbi:hypothetical protein [Microbacterium gilvum]|uniref:Scaffolding protein n=1 Tax=Microbacterium gilvum TaxID=1336204 RepID=A0ABP8ZPY1_9MICO